MVDFRLGTGTLWLCGGKGAWNGRAKRPADYGTVPVCTYSTELHTLSHVRRRATYVRRRAALTILVVGASPAHKFLRLKSTRVRVSFLAPPENRPFRRSVIQGIAQNSQGKPQFSRVPTYIPSDDVEQALRIQAAISPIRAIVDIVRHHPGNRHRDFSETACLAAQSLPSKGPPVGSSTQTLPAIE